MYASCISTICILAFTHRDQAGSTQHFTQNTSTAVAKQQPSAPRANFELMRSLNLRRYPLHKFGLQSDARSQGLSNTEIQYTGIRILNETHTFESS